MEIVFCVDGLFRWATQGETIFDELVTLVSVDIAIEVSVGIICVARGETVG
jgi:hypothetical protein